MTWLNEDKLKKAVVEVTTVLYQIGCEIAGDDYRHWLANLRAQLWC